MSIQGQGHFLTIYFPGFECFVLYYAKISGERLQNHWSSGLLLLFLFVLFFVLLFFFRKKKSFMSSMAADLYIFCDCNIRTL